MSIWIFAVCIDGMSKIVVNMSVTLDGVMQAPARPDEDLRGGFAHGGWAVPYLDSDTARALMTEGFPNAGGLLFGRRTYLDLYAVWPKRTDGNPFTPVLDNTQKWVASTTLEDPLPWQNSTLLKGDAMEAVARLKAQMAKDLVVLGSGELIQSLMRHNLVDQYVLLIHPLVLGSGRHLFPDGGAAASLQLVDSKTTTSGVVMATYNAKEA